MTFVCACVKKWHRLQQSGVGRGGGGGRRGRSVNLRTPSCHGKRVRCEDAIVRVVSRSISAENLSKWMSKPSTRVEGYSLSSCFRLRRNLACKPDERCQSNDRKLFSRISTTKRQGECFVHCKPEEVQILSQRVKTVEETSSRSGHEVDVYPERATAWEEPRQEEPTPEAHMVHQHYSTHSMHC